MMSPLTNKILIGNFSLERETMIFWNSRCGLYVEWVLLWSKELQKVLFRRKLLIFLMDDNAFETFAASGNHCLAYNVEVENNISKCGV